jgi:hypothetical protein
MSCLEGELRLDAALGCIASVIVSVRCHGYMVLPREEARLLQAVLDECSWGKSVLAGTSWNEDIWSVHSKPDEAGTGVLMRKARLSTRQLISKLTS